MSEQSEETESPVTDSGNHDNAAEDNTSEACASPEKTEARKDRGDSVGSNSTDKKKSQFLHDPFTFTFDVFLKATGDAPIMAKRKWAVSPTSKVMDIVDFVRRYLKLDQSESLFLYINQAFAPSLDQDISNLYECFGSNGKLTLHYAKTHAWG
ncbi:autophagy-related 12 isoform X1 [Rhipicephalus microplus]|uniref:autophagy-related 12 isoform X1 n=1 Tax=Rhipicephalus microplus TaxID=6941 RepID=UPI003F6C79AB